MTKRNGNKLFNDLNWNVTGFILDFLPYLLIMKKIRYINHETLYITSERVDHLKVERNLTIKSNLDNFVPLLTHPIVKNAR